MGPSDSKKDFAGVSNLRELRWGDVGDCPGGSNIVPRYLSILMN